MVNYILCYAARWKECYKLNEFKEALEGEADETDMKTWGLTKDQWSEALAAAIIAQEKNISINEQWSLSLNANYPGTKLTYDRKKAKAGTTRHEDPKNSMPKVWAGIP